MKQRLPTNEEMLTLPHVIMTVDGDWDPYLHDDDHLSTQELLRRLPSTPIQETDDFYSPQGDISAAAPYRAHCSIYFLGFSY